MILFKQIIFFLLITFEVEKGEPKQFILLGHIFNFFLLKYIQIKVLKQYAIA